MRVLLSVAYDGSAYHGWQLQPNGLTIEEVLNKNISELLGEDIQVEGASRTDAGVHALCNLAVFDTKTRIPADKLSYAINQRLPEDIVVTGSRQVPPDFHPRYVKTEKTYEYRIWNDRFANPLLERQSFFCFYELDLEKMQRAADYLIGQHDFASFCSVGSQAESTIREITAIAVKRDAALCCGIRPSMGLEGGSLVTIRVSGYGFLYNMVRIIAGTLLEVGKGKIEPEEVEHILSGRDRALAGPTAPAKGLVLADYRICEGLYDIEN